MITLEEIRIEEYEAEESERIKSLTVEQLKNERKVYKQKRKEVSDHLDAINSYLSSVESELHHRGVSYVHWHGKEIEYTNNKKTAEEWDKDWDYEF